MRQSPKGTGPQGVIASARKGRAQGLGDSALSHAMAALARAGFADATLVLRWAEIAGPDVARVAEPLKLQSGAEGAVLSLRCEAGAAVFLQHQTRTLIERLNAYLGPRCIARIRLVPGKLSRGAEPSTHPARLRPQPNADSAPAEAKPGLPDALERLARRRSMTAR